MKTANGLEDLMLAVRRFSSLLMESIQLGFFTENGTCLFRNNEPNVVSFYNDLEIREETVEFPPGATIISR